MHSGAKAGAPLPNKVDSAAVSAFLQEWGVDSSIAVPGGLKKDVAAPVSARKVCICTVCCPVFSALVFSVITHERMVDPYWSLNFWLTASLSAPAILPVSSLFKI